MAKEQKGLLVEGGDLVSKCEEGRCESQESSIIWGKVTVAKLTVLDKIVEGLEGGVNIDHCLTLSNIYKNLCN